MRRVVVAVAAVAALTGATAAHVGSQRAQRALAERFAPVVELVEQQHECGPGEPYRPIDIDTILDNDTVALRGPWSGASLVAVGPTAAMLGRGLFDYHLDFPGNPLDAGCGYEQWQQAIMGSTLRVEQSDELPAEFAVPDPR